ncbi:helix-turn-helix transcriptional regulator [Pseudooceanicola sp. CBS1P-1]|uniref:Helix-turn-helix domain-containing protein n=1 Tax=Pseudooceanicola albus TaxID=2692189 RepID=A0A6L7FZZ0_9RHOB|nr:MULTISPECIES: helix-turn-helix transcriptional regulator [Pseudooceanicola]MBT9382243.1 helix-turn-helix transcriptional regulator [Pseudooceanicola endophyticus]MXN16786.1 helix-turn-helix domain-containing protein [Pseudooceanicola albus]
MPLPSDPSQPQAARRDYPHGLDLGAHAHAGAQLIHATRGVMEIRTDRALWLVPPGQGLLMPARTPHEMRARGPVSLRTLYFAPVDPLIGPGSEPQVLAVTALLRALILALLAPPRHAGDDPERTGHLAALIRSEIVRAGPAGLRLPVARDRRLALVCDALLADPGDARGLEAWAAHAGASPRTLARLFEAEFGMSFTLWRQRLRVVSAVPRLVAQEPVTSVALSLGYETPGAFIAVFRKLTGMTPGQYGAGAGDLSDPA